MSGQDGAGGESAPFRRRRPAQPPSHGTHPKPTPERFAAPRGILELPFRRGRLHGHPLTLGIRETRRLELRPRERLGTPVWCSPRVRRNRRGSQVWRMMFLRPYSYPRGFAARRPLNRGVAIHGVTSASPRASAEFPTGVRATR